jgi:hypothetical protein
MSAPQRYDIKKDEMVPVTQADWDNAMRHIIKLNAELRGLRNGKAHGRKAEEDSQEGIR